MDFSKYGEPTKDWEEYLANHPNLLVDGSGASKQTLTEIRNNANSGKERASAALVHSSGLEGKFTIQEHSIRTRDGPSITLRSYQPAGTEGRKDTRPAFILVHGGGYLTGSLDSELFVCATIATALDVVVLHPCYRHTDEFKFPTQHDDVWDAFEWIFDHAGVLGFDPENVVIGGISAGSGIAASIVQQDLAAAKTQKRSPHIKGQVLLIPWVIYPDAFPYHLFEDRSKSSPVQCADRVGLSSAKLDWFASLLEAKDPRDLLLSPALADDDVLGSTPRTALLVAGGDPLRDQGLLYATKLSQLRYVNLLLSPYPIIKHY
jgi:acetyl esterase/lipase